MPQFPSHNPPCWVVHFSRKQCPVLCWKKFLFLFYPFLSRAFIPPQLVLSFFFLVHDVCLLVRFSLKQDEPFETFEPPRFFSIYPLFKLLLFLLGDRHRPLPQPHSSVSFQSAPGPDFCLIAYLGGWSRTS